MEGGDFYQIRNTNVTRCVPRRGGENSFLMSRPALLRPLTWDQLTPGANTRLSKSNLSLLAYETESTTISRAKCNIHCS